MHNKKIDEMRCKLDSTENPRSFEKYPTPPEKANQTYRFDLQQLLHYGCVLSAQRGNALQHGAISL